MKKIWSAPRRSFFHLCRLAFAPVLMVIGVALLGTGAWAACSGDIGKVTINEYNNLGSNNLLGSSYVEVKLLPVPVGPASGQAPLSDISGWTLKSYSKTGNLLDTKTVSSTACTGTAYRATALTLSGAGNGYVHLLDMAGKLVDVLYVDVPMPVNAVGCSLATITTDKEIQGTDANRKNVSRAPDGTGDWIQSLGSGNNSEQTLCENNLDLLKVTKSASVPSLYVGETVTFTLTVTNRTQFTTLTNVTLVDTLPAGLGRTAYTAPPGTSFDAATNTWTMATMAPGSSYTLTLTARADRVGSWINSASAYALYSGYPYQSDPAIAAVNVLQPLTLAKTVSPLSVPYNTDATFTVSVRNNSSTSLPFGFTINDTVPAGLTAGTPTPSDGSYAAGVWTIPSGMPANSTYTLTLPVTSPATAGNFTNTATAVAPFGGIDLTASATLAVGLVVSNFNVFETTTPAGAVTGRIYTKLAATLFSLDVVAIVGATAQATSFNDNVKLELLANTGAAGSGYGTDNCPISNSVLQTIASAVIAGGRSTVNFSAVADAYRDVRVRISYPTSSPAITNCSTDSFAVRPSSGMLNVTPSMATPPSASAVPTIKAGASFTLTATNSPAAGYTGTLTLDTDKLTAQTTAQDSTVQSGGSVGTLTPSSLTANASANNNASYSEVGYLYLAPGAYRDDAYTMVDQPSGCAATNSCDCVTDTTGDANLADSLAGGKYGCSIGNITAVTFGRFVPDHFLVSPGTIINRCLAGCAPSSSFTYAGEELQVNNFQLTAYNALTPPAITANYAGSYAKLDGNITANFNFGAIDLADVIPPALATAFTTGTNPGEFMPVSSAPVPSSGNGWVAGVGTFTANLALNRAAVPGGPYASFHLGINPSDTDAVTVLPVDMNLDTSVPSDTPDRVDVGNAIIRYGLVKIFNNFGPETADITNSPFEAQYYDGTRWVVNDDDNCTAGLTFDPARITAIQPVPLASGKGTFTVSKPVPAAAESLTVCLATPPWLTALTGCLTPECSSCGKFTFGIYRGNDRIINWQEIMR